MNRLSDHLAALLSTAWVGSLWAIGYLAVPILFYSQPDRHLAGLLAGEMFTRVAYVSMVCGSYLILHYSYISGKNILRQKLFWIIASMLLLSLIAHFGIQPIMAELKTHDLSLSPYGERFKMLHGVSSSLYLVQSILGIFLVINTLGKKG